MADATGCPVPQFVVHPETEEERMLLKAFSHFFWKRDEWTFGIHGFTHQDGAITAFNFGLKPVASVLNPDEMVPPMLDPDEVIPC